METKEMTKREKFRLAEVTLLVDKNPKKPGSMSHERFKGYFELSERFPDGFTVGDCLDHTLRMDDIRHDSAHKFIEINELP